MIHNLLIGKKVLIAGGSAGIGLAVAKMAQTNGAQVIVASRNAVEHKEDLIKSIGESVKVHQFDILKAEDHERLFNAIGVIDHLVITVRPDVKTLPFLEMDIDKVKLAFDIKFWGQYRLIQTAHKYLKETGSIILTSGIAGEKIYPGASTTALINTATEALCKGLAVELAPVRVNVVSPGFVEPKPAGIKEFAGKFPLKRIASSEEVAEAYIFLMQNPYITGTITVVDGGARLV